MNTVELDAAQSKWARGRGTKVMYGGVVLLLFGALGCWNTVASANAKADVATNNTISVAQQMVNICKDPQVYNKDTDGCQKAAKVASDPSQPINATNPDTQAAMSK